MIACAITPSTRNIIIKLFLPFKLIKRLDIKITFYYNTNTLFLVLWQLERTMLYTVATRADTSSKSSDRGP